VVSAKEIALKPAGLWMAAGAIITLISPMMLILEQRVDTVVGVIAVLIFMLFCSFELGAAKVIWKKEIGGWGGIVQALLVALLARALMLLAATDWYFWANVVLGVGEVVILLSIYRQKELFMPSKEEMEETLKRLAGPKVEMASECPACHAMIEPNWESCPYCGTKLQKFCAHCGHELEEDVAICPHCGTPVVSLEAINRNVETLRRAIQEDVSPETKASRYARLAMNLLKTGNNQEALDAYTEAIRVTEFPRKQSYFMVRMAKVLGNMNQTKEALDILDQALELDPEDFAEAAKVRQQILPPSPKEREGHDTAQAS